MIISRAFPSSYIKAEDLQDEQHSLIMDRVKIEEVGDDTKPVLYFQGAKKGLALNKTNANTISAAYGEETDGWVGRAIILYPTVTDFQGRQTPCIRVKVPAAKVVERDTPAAAVIAQRGNGTHRPTIRAELNDEVPF